MPEPEKPKTPPGIRTPGPDPVHKPIPATPSNPTGQDAQIDRMLRDLSEWQAERESEKNPAPTVADLVADQHTSTGRDGKIPGKI